MPKVADISDLTWLVGTWRGTVDGDPIEEVWSGPMGPCMAGVFRWMAEGQVYLYEILALEETEDQEAIHLRLRHFKEGLEPYDSEKDATPTWRLVRVGDREAVFEHASLAFPRHVVYHRVDDRTLVARLEGTKGGEPARSEFRFTRA